MIYAGIGSRETPADVLNLMCRVANRLARDGYTLRSGNAPGADQAFADGHLMAGGAPIEIYLPWPNFEKDFIDAWGAEIVRRSRPQPEAYKIAEFFHPAWGRLSRGGRALQARNVHQIVGPEVHVPVLPEFVLCWTKGGRGGGGTGQALRMARTYGVEICDLAFSDQRSRWQAVV